MLDWFRSPLLPATEQTTHVDLLWRIVMAFVLGVGVAGLHRWVRRGEAVEPTFTATLAMLATLMAMATQIIGKDVARAFSLVGALSVVRFRTVVKDTQDTAFVILAVVVGMSAGADHLEVGLIGLAILTLASFVPWPTQRSGAASTRTILAFRALIAQNARSKAEAAIAASAQRFDLIEVSSAKQGACLDLSYSILLVAGTSPATLVTDLATIAGVSSIEYRRER